MTLDSDKFQYHDQELRRNKDFVKSTRSKIIRITYKADREGRESELEMHVKMENDPFVSKTYIYIIGIAFGIIVLAGIVVVLYVFRSWFDCCYKLPCCNNNFVKAKLPEILNKFPEETYTPDKNKYNQENCPICLCSFKGDNPIRILECSHIFHGRCIVAWFTRKNDDTCPLCNMNANDRV